MAIQALFFYKDYFTIPEVKQFLRRNNIQPIKYVHTTDTYYRCRLLQPDCKKYYYRIGNITKGIDCIFEFNK